MLDLIESFLEYKRIDHHCRDLTLSAYRGDLGTFSGWCGGRSFESLSKADLRCFVADMQAEGLSLATIRRRWSCIHQFYEFLVNEEEVLERSPAKGFKFPAINREEAFYLQSAQRKQLFDFLISQASDRLGKLDLALLGLLYYTALRVSEGLSRTFADIVSGQGHHYLRVVGKRGKERVVVIHPTAFAWLEDYLTTARPAVDLDFLFIHPVHRGVVSRRFVWRRLKRAMRFAGFDGTIVKRASPHCLRHSRASDLVRAGCSVLLVQKFLAHSSVTTTQIYTHISDPELDAAVLRVD